MWVFTTGGFVSAVDKGMVDGVPSERVVVRARDRESLVLLVSTVELLDGEAGVEIHEGTGTDYKYRVEVSKEDFAEWLRYEALTQIDYDNFKNALLESRGSVWSSASSRVWVAMLSVEDE